MDTDTRNYELAYLVSPTLSEEEALAVAGKLAALIEEQKGIVSNSEKPSKRKLAYPVKKNSSAYFGWIDFFFSADRIKDLERKIRELELLRWIILEGDKRAASVITTTKKEAKKETAKVSSKKQAKAAVEEKEHIDLEALDKKLEEILGK